MMRFTVDAGAFSDAMSKVSIHECALRTFYDPCIYGWPR